MFWFLWWISTKQHWKLQALDGIASPKHFGSPSSFTRWYFEQSLGQALETKLKNPLAWPFVTFFLKNSLKALNGHIYTKSTCVCRQHVLTIGQKGFEQDLRKTMTWNQENQGLFKTWLISSFLAFQSSSSWFSMFSTIDVFAGLILRYLRWGLCSLLAGARPSRVSRRRGMSLVWMLDHSLWLEKNGVGCFWNKKIDRN